MRVKRLLGRHCWTMTAIAVFLYAAIRLAAIGWGYYENREALGEARDLWMEARPDAAWGGEFPVTVGVYAYGEDGHPERLPQPRSIFQPLLKLNPDIAGWIKLNGSRIDYPVVQGPDNEWYLHRNYKGEESRAGSIFMDFRNRPGAEERHTILYGHRMKDGTMFGDLKYYTEREYYDAHREFRLDTLYESYIAEVFSAYYTTTEFNYIETEFADDAAFGAFLEQIKRRSLYNGDMGISVQDRIVTLSTCDYLLDPVNGRFVVHARLKRAE
ncbi:sortase B [Paenibacillus sp. UNCCL117]|uniref:class B sortase n=1 Tax=unclassified Paenibacillus TaxID=185978 RepID=UPI0008878F91|nr:MULTISPECIES: class B sortase [unclassified Paenibacillus]SDE60787.1 sortase B. Cysteine peptidase. MEROPS family C60B [Paenibacillus sp. cl123]SFW69628.1 sortase B [Paenibacillus sp. UNCCL117]